MRQINRGQAHGCPVSELPTTPKRSYTSFDTFAKLRARGFTILVVEQMAWLGLEICDRAHVLETGRIALSGTSQELAANPRVMEAYLGSAA